MKNLVADTERCTVCVMPRHFIRCSEEGVCAFCLDDDRRLKYKGEDALRELLDRTKSEARSRGAEFDCLCAISGGKDSTYAMHQCATKYGMRVLAFTYDHGFADGQAQRNIENAVAALRIPLVRSGGTGVQRRYLRHNLAAVLNQGEASQGVLSSLLCVGCSDGYVRGANRLARDRGIPIVVQGGAPVEPDMKGLYDPFTSYTKNVVLKPVVQVLTHRMFYHPSYPKNPWYHVSALRGCLKSWLGRLLPQKEGVSRCQFFSYVPYEDSRIVDTLERDLAWRRPPGRSSSTRFDCKIHWLLDIIRQKAWGLTDKEVVYSCMVRKGLLARDEALRRVEVEEREEEALRDEVVVDVLRRLDRMDLLDQLRALYHK